MMKTFIFSILILISFNLQGQKNDSVVDDNIYFHFKNLSFIKDNEYFNLIADGYTLFGDKSDFTLSYSYGKHYKFYLGFETLYNFGDNKINYVKPILSLQIFSGKNMFVFGKLQTKFSHNFSNPLYDFERLLDSRSLEYGVQHIYTSEVFTTDTWLQWEKFIYKADNNREILNFGHSSILKYSFSQKIKIAFPLGIYLHHRGGQINLRHENNTLNNAMVLMNARIGFSPQYEFNDSSVGLDFNYYINRFNTDNPEEFHFKKGNAFWLQAYYRTRGFVFGTGYWNSYKFVSSQGNDMFQTYSRRTEIYVDQNNQIIPVFANYTEPERQMLTFNVFYHKKLFPKLELSAKFDSYLQLNSSEINTSVYNSKVAKNHFDYCIGLYIVYKLDKKL